jgi:hypothetical protein
MLPKTCLPILVFLPFFCAGQYNLEEVEYRYDINKICEFRRMEVSSFNAKNELQEHTIFENGHYAQEISADRLLSQHAYLKTERKGDTVNTYASFDKKDWILSTSTFYKGDTVRKIEVLYNTVLSDTTRIFADGKLKKILSVEFLEWRQRIVKRYSYTGDEVAQIIESADGNIICKWDYSWPAESLTKGKYKTTVEKEWLGNNNKGRPGMVTTYTYLKDHPDQLVQMEEVYDTNNIVKRIYSYKGDQLVEIKRVENNTLVLDTYFSRPRRAGWARNLKKAESLFKRADEIYKAKVKKYHG